MLRQVIEDPHFQSDFDLLRNVYHRLDDVHAAITWTLASNPRVGVVIETFPHPTIRLFKSTPIDDTPSFLILYRYTDQHVILLAIDVSA